MADLGWQLPAGAAGQIQRTSDYITSYERVHEDNKNFAREDLLNAVKQNKLVDCGDEHLNPVTLICDCLDGNFRELVNTAILTTNNDQIANKFKVILDKAIKEAVEFIAEQRTNNMDF